MADKTPVVRAAELVALNTGRYFHCWDKVEPAEKTVYGIGNAYVPDHVLTCNIPRNCRNGYPHGQVKVRVHVIWLQENDLFDYFALVADKADCNLYWLKVETYNVTHGYRRCCFRVATLQEIMEKAVEHNAYLNNVIAIARKDRERLLDYQVYSNLSGRFCYMEIPYGNRVVMCGAGLHRLTTLEVGLVGKASIKDFFVSYAECTGAVYEKLKAEMPSLYDRASNMEKNRPMFFNMNVFCEKRSRYPELSELLAEFRGEPAGRRTVDCFTAGPYGTSMQHYSGDSLWWMEEFIERYRKRFRASNLMLPIKDHLPRY